MSASSIDADVRRFITDNFPLRRKSDVIDDEESLMDAGVIDSAGVLELVEFVESHFEIAIPFEDLVPENFDTIASITTYVSSRLVGARPDVSA